MRSRPLRGSRVRRGRIQISLRWLFLLVLLAAVAAWYTGDYLRRTREVRFGDPHLQWAAQAALGNRPVQQQDLPHITHLDIQPAPPARRLPPGTKIKRPIVQLDGIERCRNLRKLSFTYIELTDSQPLANLKNFEHLQFDTCTIRDLSAIDECDGLRTLRLPGLVCPFPPLERLERLERVEIKSGRPDHWRALAGLAQLRELRFEGNFGDDLDLLAGMPELRVLELTRNSQRASTVIQEDLAPLSQLVHLRRLSLVACYRFDQTSLDIAPLRNLTELRQLRLAVNGIEDISPLAGLTDLRELSLSGNHISDLRPIANLQHLECLYLDGNRISDITALSRLRKLQWLSLGYNAIQDISALTDLTDLRTVLLNDNRIQDVSPFTGLPKLGQANSVGPHADWDPIFQRRKHAWTTRNRDAYAGHVDLSSNQIRDVTPLVYNLGLDDGDRVDLRGNRLSAASLESVKEMRRRGVLVFTADDGG